MKIAVIGAGIGGLASAWGLVKHGHSVDVFEKERVGAGSSGAALGALFPFPADVKSKMADYQRESLRIWPAWACELADETGIALDDFWRSYADGVMQVRLPMLLGVLRKAVEARGVAIKEGVAVHGWQEILDNYDAVVLAAGFGNMQLGGGPMHVLKGQALRMRLDPAKAIVTKPLKNITTYVIPLWEDNEVMVGSYAERMAEPDGKGPDPEITKQLIAAAAEKLCPAVAEGEILEVWVGDRPAHDGVALPMFRPVADKVVALRGMGKLGYCLAPAVARDVVEAVEG